MKNIIAWVSAAVVALILIVASLSVHANTTITTEAVQALEDSIDDTVDALLAEELYTVDNKEQFVSAFIQGLMQRIESSSEIRVEVLDSDQTTGVLSMRVIVVFKQPNGKESSVSSECTVIFDRETPEAIEAKKPVYYTVTFYYDKEDMTEEGIYKEYKVEKGSPVSIPIAPVMEDKIFKVWKNMETGGDITWSDTMVIDENMVYYGTWK